MLSQINNSSTFLRYLQFAEYPVNNTQRNQRGAVIGPVFTTTNSIIRKTINWTDTKHCHIFSQYFTESGPLFSLLSTNKKSHLSLYEYENKIWNTYISLKTLSGVSHTGLTHCQALIWFSLCCTDRKVIYLFSAPSLLLSLFLMFLYFSSILQGCWMLMSRKWYKTTDSLFQMKSSAMEGPTFFHFGVLTEAAYVALSRYIGIG